MQLRTIVLLLAGLSWVCSLTGQTTAAPRQIQGLRTEQNLKIDGILDEPEWNKALPVTNFKLNFPADTAFAASKTTVWVVYNDQYLYIAAQLNSATGSRKKYTVSSLKRDFLFSENDAFGIIIDPFSDHTNGYGLCKCLRGAA